MRKRLIEKFTKAKEGSFGYTMTELLVVVAIIAIVAAIAIPSVIAISRALKFKRVNDHAKSIFLAAQQNLTEMRSDGGLKPLQSEEAAGMIIQSPSFPEEFSNEYVYTTSQASGDAFELILPVGSVEGSVRSENIIIEYNPITGNVYSVFYYEDDKDIFAMYADPAQDLPRNAEGDKEERKNMMLGYYDGSGLNSSQLEIEEVRATVEFINGEEGIVRVLVPVPDDFFGNLDEYAKAMTINLSVTGEYSMVQAASGAAEGESGETTQTPGYMFSVPIKVAGPGLGDNCYVEYGNTIVVEYPIDSLVNYGSFANYSSTTYDGAKNAGGTDAKAHLTDLMDETRFTILPGENVTLEAEVKVDSEIRVEVENGILSGVNPMFEYLQPDGSNGYVLAVSNGRNLQNLNAIAPTIAKQVSSVVFTSDIYWNDTVSYYNDKYDTKTSAPGYQNEAAENPARALPYFVPIHHEDLFGTAKFIFPGEGDGGLGEIINLIIGKIEEIFFGGFYNAKVPTLTDELDAASGVKHANIQGNGHKIYNINIDSTQYTIPNVGEKGSVLNPETNKYVETDLTGKFYATGENQIIDYCFTGLFGYVNTPIDNLHVVNPIVKGHEFTKETTVVQNYIYILGFPVPIGTSRVNLYNNPATGALIGVGGFNTLVTDCSTYIDKDAHGFNPAYFYHGDFSKTAAQTWYGVSGEGAVGGLVGYAKSHRNVSGELTNDKAVLAFSKCFAAVPVTGNMRGTNDKDFGYSNGVGAFIGNSQITNFYNCYASGDVKATGARVYQTDLGSLVPNAIEKILLEWFGPSGSATTFPYSGRTSMGAGGFVGSSHGTRYSNCFATGDVVTTGECAGGFVGFMSIDETFAYGNDAKIAQRTVFTDCYAVGSATNGNGRQENFSGGNGRVVLKLDTTMSYFVNDYYRLYAPYYARTKAEPKYGTNGAMYVFRDSYYLSSDPDKAMENTNECAIPASYEVLQNLIGSHSTGTDGTGSSWIKARIKAIKDIVIDEDSDRVWVKDNSWVGGHYEYITITYTYDTEYFIPNAPTLHDLYISEYAESYNGGNNGWEAATPATTHSYELETAGAVYPFSKLYGMDYYGDWPSEPAAAGLAYYESYVNDDNTYYYFDRKSTATTTDHLSNVVDQDGYAVLSQKSDNISVTIGTKTQSLGAKEGGAETFEAGSSVYYIFVLNETLMDEAAKLCTNGSFYVPMTVSQAGDTYTMYFNPYVYLSQVNPVYGTKNAVQPDDTDVPKTMYIRSARQFAGLSKLSNYWTANYSYIQQFSINANTYLWDDAAQDKKVASIGTSAKPFNASYRSANDNQFRIEGFQYANTASGLFGVIGSTGKVENLVVACTSVDLDNANASDVAVVAAHNGGTISNVDVSISGNVLLKGKTNAGLLAGYSSGTIKDCDIGVAQTSASVSMTATNAGGLVGCVEGTGAQKAIVTNCTLNVSSEIEVSGTGNAGGLIGQAKHLNLTATEPLVTMTKLTAANAAYAGGLAGWMEDSEVKITDAASVTSVTFNTLSAAKGTAAGFLGGGKNVVANGVDVTAGTVSGNIAAGFLGTGTNVDAEYCDVVITNSIQGETKAAGVAGTIGAQSVFNYVTVNHGSKVTATNGNAAGYAVELAAETDVMNGSVTLNNTTISASGNAAGYACSAAGYVGSSNGSSVPSSVVRNDGKNIISGANAAGFACEITGQVSGAFVTPALNSTKYLGNSNENLVVNGTTSAAGFALTVGEDATVTNCYALNKIQGGTVTGFVTTNKGTITGCMANVTISGGKAFVATNNGTVTRCYGWYGDGDASKTETNAEVGGKVYSAYFADLNPVDKEGDIVTLYAADGKMQVMTATELQGAANTLAGSNHKWYTSGYESYPYTPKPANMSKYLYPMLRDHYGDWITPPQYAYGVAYYEIYSTPAPAAEVPEGETTQPAAATIKLHMVDLSEQQVTEEGANGKSANYTDTFDNNGTIVKAGYAVFSKAGLNVLSSYAGEKIADLTYTLKLNDSKSVTYDFYELKADASGIVNIGATAVSQKTAEVQTWFADAINVTDNTYRVRTPEQLANVAQTVAASFNFSQTHDIAVTDFTTVEKLSGNYAGNGLKLSVSGQTKTWLNEAAGKVENLKLVVSGGVNAPVFGTVSGTVTLSGLTVDTIGAEGALAETVSGTVNIPAVQTAAVSGKLFGEVTGTVTTKAISVTGTAAQVFGNVTGGSVTVDGAINVTGTAAKVFGDISSNGNTEQPNKVTVNGLITTGDLTGNAIGSVSANMTLNGITVGNIPAEKYVIAEITGGTVSTGAVTVNNVSGQVFGEIKGGTVTVGAVSTKAVGTAASGETPAKNANIFGDVSGGSVTVASINTNGNAVNGNVFGTVGGSGVTVSGPITTGAVTGNVFGDATAAIKTGDITVNGDAGKVFGKVAGAETGNITVSGNAAQVFGEVSGKVTTGAITTGNVTGNVFGDVKAEVSTGAITTGNVTGNVFGAVTAKVTANGINAGTVGNVVASAGTNSDVSTGAIKITSGQVIGPVSGGKVETGTITVDSVTANSIVASVSGGEVTLGDITINPVVTKDEEGNVIETKYADVPTLIGEVNGGTVTGAKVDLVSANIPGGIFASVKSGTVQNFNVTTTGAMSAPLVGGDSLGGTLDNVDVTAGSATVESGVLVNSVASGKTVKNCAVTITGKVEATGTTVGGLTGSNAGTLSGNTVNIGTLTATGTNATVGGLVGTNGGTISGTTNVTVTTLSGGKTVGGLAGINSNTISETTNVTVTTLSGSDNVGGLVGTNSGTISGTAKVLNTSLSGGKTVGGLVATNNGTVSSKATVDVSISSDGTTIGGLIAIHNSTGAISGADVKAAISYTGKGGTTIGGIVGEMKGGSLMNSKASGSIVPTADQKGKANAIGGAIGKISAGTVGENNENTPTVVTTSVTVDPKWAGATKVATDATFGSSGITNNGPVGMFVGYAAGVTFTNCESTAANETYQFVGEATFGTPVTIDGLWSSNLKSDKTALNAYSDTDKLSDTSYKAYAGNVTAEMHSGVTSCKSVSTQFNNCTFYLGKEIREQTYGADTYFYGMKETAQSQYTVGTSAVVPRSSTEKVTVKSDQYNATPTPMGKYYEKDGKYYLASVKYEQTGSGLDTKFTFTVVATNDTSIVLDSKNYNFSWGDIRDLLSGKLKAYVTFTFTNFNAPTLSGKYSAINNDGKMLDTAWKACDIPANRVIDKRDEKLNSCVWDATDSKITGATTSVVLNNGIPAIEYKSGDNTFQLYPVTEGPAPYKLLTFTYQPNAEYQRQFVTSEKVGEVPTTLSEEPEIPAEEIGGETGNNT